MTAKPRPINPHLARALIFLGGVGLSALSFLAAPLWVGLLLSLLFVGLAHVWGERAFKRLATHDEIVADLRERTDAID